MQYNRWVELSVPPALSHSEVICYIWDTTAIISKTTDYSVINITGQGGGWRVGKRKVLLKRTISYSNNKWDPKDSWWKGLVSYATILGFFLTPPSTGEPP